MENERNLLCCRARIWTGVIAFIQALSSLLVLIYTSVELIRMNKTAVKYSEDGVTEGYSVLEGTKLTPPLEKSFSNILLVVTVNFMLPELILGIMLMWGVKLKNSRILLSWILAEMIVLVLLIFFAVWMLSIDQFLIFLGVFIALSFTIWGLYIVDMYREELCTKTYRVETSASAKKLMKKMRHRDGESKV